MAARVPSSKILPLLGWYNPVSSLIKVVFPGGFRKVFFNLWAGKRRCRFQLILDKTAAMAWGWFFLLEQLGYPNMPVILCQMATPCIKRALLESCTHSQTNITFRGRTCSVQDLNSSPFLSPPVFWARVPWAPIILWWLSKQTKTTIDSLNQSQGEGLVEGLVNTNDHYLAVHPT